MRRFLVGTLATLGALTLLLVAGVVAATVYLARTGPEMPERVVLTLDLREAPSETPEEGPLTWLGLRRELSQSELLLALDRAARDPRVAGLFARVDGGGPGLAQTQEIRDAVARLRAEGKFALAFADTFGELSPGTVGYYLATAFDEVHLQPLGFVGLTGVMFETPLAGELLADLGVDVQIEARGEYKSVAEMFTRAELSPAHREMLNWLADDVIEQITVGIAAGRGMDEAAVARLIDDGPYLAEEAVEAGLVDALGYEDEVLEQALVRAGGARRLSVADYAGRVEPEAGDDAPAVALIHGAGQIVRGESEEPLVGAVLMGADTVADALSAATEDPEVGAILLRIDSGGGSVVASETIAREVRRAVEAGKPVIVSMAATAASGGYWIAMHANRIVAAPGTLTGSIGVVGGKPVITGLSDELGVNWGTVARGDNAAMFSPLEPYGPAARERLEAFLDAVYGAFVAGVAEGRGMPVEAVREVAGGRVWTGAQAADLGLVDELGGLTDALAAAKEAMGLEAGEPVRLRLFPEARGPLEEVIDRLPLAVTGLDGSVAAVGRLVEHLSRPGALSAPPITVR